jgi:uncharacterized membrane protein YdjX (TVP38/TMEM64 family)
MVKVLNEIYNYIIFIINNSPIYGPLIASTLIFFESILPVLPLFVFITVLFLSFGHFWGFIISYILTCLGCIFSFFLCRKLLKKSFENKIRKYEYLNRFMIKIDKIELKYLVLLVAMPFTPAFMINLAGGLSKMNFKKYLLSIIIGKLSLVFFWGFIGTSLVESLRHPKILIVIGLLLLISFLISKYVAKKLNVE